LFPLFLYGKALIFRGQKCTVKVVLLRKILHFWEILLSSGITSYKGLLLDEKVFDPRSNSSYGLGFWLEK
jgi:hypothetical protein